MRVGLEKIVIFCNFVVLYHEYKKKIKVRQVIVMFGLPWNSVFLGKNVKRVINLDDKSMWHLLFNFNTRFNTDFLLFFIKPLLLLWLIFSTQGFLKLSFCIFSL